MTPLLLLFLSLPALPADAGLDTLDLSGHTVVLSADDGYRSLYEYAYPLLKKHGMTMTLAVIGDYLTRARSSYRSNDLFLNRAEIQEMIDSCGIEIASHSLSHPFLTRISAAKAWHEISASRSLLESTFGVEIITFVYPYGDMNGQVRQMVADAGYRLARAVRPGNPDFGNDQYRIPEVELLNTTALSQIQHHIRRHRVTVLLFHNITTKPRVFTEWGVADFSALLDWMDARNVTVATLGGLYRTWWRQKVTKELLAMVDAASAPRRMRLFEDVDVDATGTLHPR